MDSSAQSPLFAPGAGLSQAMTAERTSAPPAGPLSLTPLAVARVLGALVLFLVAANIVTAWTGVADQIFGLDVEQNVPTYVSTLLLVGAAGLLSLIAIQKRRCGDRFSLQWGALSAVFLYLSMDELIGFHEMTGPRVERLVETGGPFYYASTLFTGSLVLLVAAFFFRFLLHLPRRYAILFSAAAGLYVGGALGAEMVGGLLDETRGTDNVLYLATTTVEETMEMSGVVLFIYALLEYMRVKMAGVQVRLGASEQ